MSAAPGSASPSEPWGARLYSGGAASCWARSPGRRGHARARSGADGGGRRVPRGGSLRVQFRRHRSAARGRCPDGAAVHHPGRRISGAIRASRASSLEMSLNRDVDYITMVIDTYVADCPLEAHRPGPGVRPGGGPPAPWRWPGRHPRVGRRRRRYCRPPGGALLLRGYPSGGLLHARPKAEDARAAQGGRPAPRAQATSFVASGGWVGHLVLAETTWVLSAVYGLAPAAIVTAVEMLLNHQRVTIQDAD